jgi:hypothetical protein
VDKALEDELTRRGITTRRARQLLAKVCPAQDVVRQLEWGDFLISRAAPGTFWNPAGFYVALLRDNVDPPPHFLSYRQQAERDEARQTRVEDREHRARLYDAYGRYRDEQALAHLAGMDEGDRERALDVKAQELRSRFPTFSWTAEHLRSVAETSLRSEIAARLPLLDFHSFVNRTPVIGVTPVEFSEEASCSAHAM